MRFAKMNCIDTVLRRVIKREPTLKALFDDNPELEVFTFSKTQEYDDNNYYNSVQLQTVNGYGVDSEGNYEYDDDDEETNHPKLAEEICRYIADYISDIGEHFEDEEDIEVCREDYENEVLPASGKVEFDPKSDEEKYVKSFLFGTTLPDSFFIKADPRFAVWYADDHGRFDPKIEKKIFAQKGRMEEAFYYALHVLKGPLPDAIENFFTLRVSMLDKSKMKEHDKDTRDYKFFQRYLNVVKKVEKIESR